LVSLGAAARGMLGSRRQEQPAAAPLPAESRA